METDAKKKAQQLRDALAHLGSEIQDELADAKKRADAKAAKAFAKLSKDDRRQKALEALGYMSAWFDLVEK